MLSVQLRHSTLTVCTSYSVYMYAGCEANEVVICAPILVEAPPLFSAVVLVNEISKSVSAARKSPVPPGTVIKSATLTVNSPLVVRAPGVLASIPPEV